MKKIHKKNTKKGSVYKNTTHKKKQKMRGVYESNP